MISNLILEIHKSHHYKNVFFWGGGGWGRRRREVGKENYKCGDGLRSASNGSQPRDFFHLIICIKSRPHFCRL